MYNCCFDIGINLCVNNIFVATFKNGNLLNQHPQISSYSKKISLQKKCCFWFWEKEHHTHGWYYKSCTTTVALTWVLTCVSTIFFAAKFKNSNLLNQHPLIPIYSKKTFISLQKKCCCWFLEKECHTHGWYYKSCTTIMALTQVSSGVSTTFLRQHL